ncbi:hypothetical protein [Luethyella okanaganae]|uniref:GNAT family N-acetyltransferase n=1 Tax=Luethyella okanaganae TaxID=69372 RepID=A0ABW1VD88_9MICO
MTGHTAAFIDDAFRLADAAGATAGVAVRLVAPGDLASVVGLFERTWGVGRSPDASMLQALDHAGNTVLIATDATSRRGAGPVGATLGFLGWSGGTHLHSHMNAVVPWRRSGGVGYALKLFQRAICLQNGVDEMRWTFDPLIRRNAHFNLVKLGAEVTHFWPDFYGRLDDTITGSDRSDRFEVRWRLASERTVRAVTGQPQPEWNADDRLELDADFETLRAENVDVAARLREESRRLFGELMERGLRPELDGENDYVFTADDVDRRADHGGSP